MFKEERCDGNFRRKIKDLCPRRESLRLERRHIEHGKELLNIYPPNQQSRRKVSTTNLSVCARSRLIGLLFH